MDIIIIFKTNEHGYLYKSQETRFSYYAEVKKNSLLSRNLDLPQ